MKNLKQERALIQFATEKDEADTTRKRPKRDNTRDKKMG